MPSRVKAEAEMGKCTICSTEIRLTKTNTEARTHADSRHPNSTFALCFPGAFDPTAVVAAAPVAATSSSSSSSSASDAHAHVESSAATLAAPPIKKKAPKQDLSFLDASIAPPKGGKK